MTALFILAQQYRADADKLADLELDAQTVKDTLDAMGGELELKACATAMVVRNMEALAAQIKDAEKVMADRRKAIESRAASLSAYLLANMAYAGIQSIDTPHFAIRLKANPPSVQIEDDRLIPAEFMRQPAAPPAAPDKAAIKVALQKGIDVQGARLVQGSRVEIK